MIPAWEIGVKIAMSSNASAVLSVIQRDLFGLHRSVDMLTGRLNMMKVAAVGAMTALAGGAALAGMAKLVEAGKELVHQQALMKAAGMDQRDIAEATAKAWKIAADVRSSSVVENAQAIRELRMVFGSTEEAIAHLAPVARAQAVMNSVRGHGAGDQVFDMAKALEIKGVSMDPEHFQALLNGMVAAAIASGGRVLGSDFLSAFKYGRTATQGWGDDFVKTILPTLIQEMKGGGGIGAAGGPGNALQSMFQAVVGGVMSNKAAEEFYKLGLVDAHKIIFTKTGSVKGIRPGGVAGAEEFQANPYQWVQDYLMPALAKKGITSPEAIREEIAHLFVNRTGQQIATMFATQQLRFEKDATLIGKAAGANGYDQLIATDPTMKIEAFTKAWHNLLVALGVPLVDTSMNLLDKLTNVLTDLGQWAAKHPQTVGTIEEVAAGVAALAVAAGAFAVGSAAASALGLLAGPTGLIALAAGITAVAGAFNVLPPWLVKIALGAAAGAMVGARVGGGTGALVGAVVGGTAATAAGIPAGLGPDLSHPGAGPSHLTNEPVGAGLKRWLGLSPPPPPAAPGNGAPVPVTITNPGDLARGYSGHVDRTLNRPNGGSPGFDYRAVPAQGAVQ